MSLTAWYPLNKNFEDYSISFNHATGSVPASDDGKTGKTFAFSSHHLTIKNPIDTPEFTVCTWVKYNSTSNQSIFTARSVMGNGISLFNLGGAFRFDAGSQWSISYAIPTGKWIHVAFVKSKTHKRFYLNGVLHSQVADASAVTNSYAEGTIGASQVSMSGHGNYLNGSLNDLRFYDEVLSAKEIKEISKAKVLHYSFNMQKESTTNLCEESIVTNSTPGGYKPGWDASLHTDAITVNNWGTGYNGGVGSPNVGYHASWVFSEDGTPAMKFPNLNNSNGLTLGSRWLGISRTVHSVFGIANKVVTVSWYQKTDTIGTQCHGGPYFRRTTDTGHGFHAGMFYKKNTVKDQWQRMSHTFTMPSNLDTAQTVSFYFYGNSSSTQGTFYVKDIQFEYKDHATPFVFGTSLAKLGDGSGLGHQSSEMPLATCPVWKNLSCMGTGAFYFDGTQSFKHPNPFLGQPAKSQEWTVAAWVKINSDSPAGTQLNNFNSGNNLIQSTTPLLYLNSGTHDYYVYGSKVLDKDKWIHVAYVFRNSDGLRRIYLNGVNVSGTGPNLTSTPAGIPNEVTVGSKLKGAMADYCIYATALSDADIKALYESRGSISDNGKIFAHEFIEESGAKPGFNIKGQFKASGISEVAGNVLFNKDNTMQAREIIEV